MRNDLRTLVGTGPRPIKPNKISCTVSVHVCTGPVVYVMDVVDRVVYKLCPFVAGGIFIGSVYWTAVTYGAVTVMQVHYFYS